MNSQIPSKTEVQSAGFSPYGMGLFGVFCAGAAIFADEGIEVGAVEVAYEAVAEIVQDVTLGGKIADADGFWSDAVGSELLREPNVDDWFASPGFGAGVVGEPVQAGDESASEEGFGSFGGEDDEDIEKERAHGAG